MGGWIPPFDSAVLPRAQLMALKLGAAWIGGRHRKPGLPLLSHRLNSLQRRARNKSVCIWRTACSEMRLSHSFGWSWQDFPAAGCILLNQSYRTRSAGRWGRQYYFILSTESDFFPTAKFPKPIYFPLLFNEDGRIWKNRLSKLHRFWRDTSLIKTV